MSRTLRLLGLLVGLAAGELQSKKVLNYAAEINKDFMKEYQAEKAAKKAAQAEGAAPPSALADARKLLGSKGEEPSKASEPSSAVSVSGGGRLAVLRLPEVFPEDILSGGRELSSRGATSWPRRRPSKS